MTTFNLKWNSLRELYQWDPAIVRLMILVAILAAGVSAALMMYPFSVWNWEIIVKGVVIFSFALVSLLCMMIVIVPADGVTRSLISSLALLYMMLCFACPAITMSIVRDYLHRF